MFSPTFLNSSLIFAIRNLWSEPQWDLGLVFADSIELLHLWCKDYNQFDFSIDHLVMSMCRVVSCVVGRGCLLWLACYLNKTLLAFALLHFVLQRQTCLLFFYLLTSYFCILVPRDEKDISFWWHHIHNQLTALQRRQWHSTPVLLPGGLQSMGSLKVRHNWATELNWTIISTNMGKNPLEEME